MSVGTAVLMNGYLSSLAAAVLFGIQYVPVKKHEIFDGTVFQWFMCSGILFAGVVLGVLSAGGVPQVALTDLAGGMFWTAQNMLLMPVVKFLGLGLSFAIYSATNVLSGYTIGRFGLFGSAADPGRLPWLRDTGAAFLVASFAVMVHIRPEVNDQQQETGPQARSAINMLSQGAALSKKQRASSCPDFASLDAPEPSSWEHERKRPSPVSPTGLADPLMTLECTSSVAASRAESLACLCGGQGLRGLGVMLVTLAGLLNALSALPFNWWLLRNQSTTRSSFVFAQALGTWMVSTTLYLIYASVCKMLGHASPPHTCIRPAFLSGLFWALGFVCMCNGIDGLGFTAGYTYVAVLPVVVSSLLSVFWFREIRGRRQMCLFVLCFLIQSVGVVCVAVGSH